MSLYCRCPDWEPNIKKVNGPFILQQIRQPGSVQPVKQFTFCPWCGERLAEKCETCGALLMPGEQAEGHYVYSTCKRPKPVTEHPMLPGTCKKCGRPTFGPLCGECKGEHLGGSLRSA